MDLIALADIAAAAKAVAHPLVLAWIVGGVAIGLIFGAAPGLTATAGVAIATPLTFGLGFETSMALLLGIYCAGYFAGSIPAILINTPGAPGNAATALDGNALARRGEADFALTLAVVSSFVGGLFSVVVLMLMAPALAGFALEFTSAEYCMLGIFGLICVSAVSGGSLIKGAIAAVLGMVLGTVGIDPVGGLNRLTFDIPELLGGIPLLPALIAFLAVTEVLNQGAGPAASAELPPQRRFRLAGLLPVYLRHRWAVLKGAVIGTFIGILPGTGPTIASWMAYGEAARNPPPGEAVGSGSPRGIIAAETANNAVTGGALVPLLTLGIPGDSVTAILIGALLIQGIDPGPFFIAQNGNLFAQILLVLLVANAFVLVFGLGARRVLPSILKLPPRILVPIIGVLSATGGFAINNAPFEVGLIAVLGIAGYVLLRFGVAMPPLVIGLVLGPIVEVNLRNALTASRMDVTVFVTRPISAALVVAIVATIALSWWRATRPR